MFRVRSRIAHNMCNIIADLCASALHANHGGKAVFLLLVVAIEEFYLFYNNIIYILCSNKSETGATGV